jgi:electron transfer flavoprotein beta subunit
VQRRAEGGVQVLKTKLPALVTVLEGINEMRFATMADMFRAARYPLKIWDKTAAGVEDETKIGLKGSPTVVAKVFAPTPKAQKAEMVETHSGAPKDLAGTLLAKLFTRYPQLEREIAR